MGRKNKNGVIYGWGINDADYRVTAYTKINDKSKCIWICPIYEDWKGIIRRAKSDELKNKYPTYETVTVCEEWKHFSVYRKWVLEEQPNDDWMNCAPDKDLLTDTKHYSPNTVAYVCVKVNNFIKDRRNDRGICMLGVNVYKNTKKLKYVAQCNNPFTGKQEHLGYFLTELEAHKAWQAKKHEYACLLAEQQQDPRVAKALRERYAPNKDWSNR